MVIPEQGIASFDQSKMGPITRAWQKSPAFMPGNEPLLIFEEEDQPITKKERKEGRKEERRGRHA